MCALITVPSTERKGRQTSIEFGSLYPTVGSKFSHTEREITRPTVPDEPNAEEFPPAVKPPITHCSGGGPGLSGFMPSSSPQHCMI